MTFLIDSHASDLLNSSLSACWHVLCKRYEIAYSSCLRLHKHLRFSHPIPISLFISKTFVLSQGLIYQLKQCLAQSYARKTTYFNEII